MPSAARRQHPAASERAPDAATYGAASRFPPKTGKVNAPSLAGLPAFSALDLLAVLLFFVVDLQLSPSGKLSGSAERLGGRFPVAQGIVCAGPLS